MQVDALVAATAGEYVFGGQAVHGCVPAAGLYVPAAHETQPSSPSSPSPVYPGAHSHAALPGCEVAFCAQRKQAEAPAPEKLPAPHASHPALPGALLNCPGAHSVESKGIRREERGERGGRERESQLESS